MLKDCETLASMLDWLDQQPIEMAADLAAAHRVLESTNRMHLLLKHAAARVRLANDGGDPILSAWLSEAEAAIAKVEGRA